MVKRQNQVERVAIVLQGVLKHTFLRVQSAYFKVVFRHRCMRAQKRRPYIRCAELCRINVGGDLIANTMPQIGCVRDLEGERERVDEGRTAARRLSASAGSSGASGSRNNGR